MWIRKFQQEIIKKSDSKEFEEAIREWECYYDFSDKKAQKRYKIDRMERIRQGEEIPTQYCPCGRQLKYGVIISNKKNLNMLIISKGCFDKNIGLIDYSI